MHTYTNIALYISWNSLVNEMTYQQYWTKDNPSVYNKIH